MAATRKRDDVRIGLRRWYRRHARDLPWRRNRDPYRVLVSEIMLQQTQVERVRIGYAAFLRSFPSLRSLARARRSDVVVAWGGMGYNNRAVRLHELARTVTRNYRGTVPSTVEDLLALPGIGRYTANAVMTFAFGARCPLVEVNIRRVLSRVFSRMRDTASLVEEEAAWKLAAEILPARATGDWHQALMDLGATVCSARQPRCGECPLASHCASRARMRPAPQQTSREEKGKAGVPNRIYRGRIISTLRTAPRLSGLRLTTIARAVVPGFTRKHHAWFCELVGGLEKDGLIRVSGAGASIHRRARLA